MLVYKFIIIIKILINYLNLIFNFYINNSATCIILRSVFYQLVCYVRLTLKHSMNYLILLKFTILEL